MAQTNPWPGVRNWLQSCGADLTEAIKALGSGTQMRSPLHYADGALEKVVKTLLFAERIDFVHKHALEDNIKRLPGPIKASLEQEIAASRRDELTKFRVAGPHAGSNPPWPETSAEQLIASVQRVCASHGDHIFAVIGKQPHEVGYEQWLNNNDALGGWATLPLDRYPQITAMRLLLAGRLTAARLGDIEMYWLWSGIPANAMESVAAVRTEPDAWRSLFVKTRNRETRTNQ
jgi:HEPN domain-containing protein